MRRPAPAPLRLHLRLHLRLIVFVLATGTLAACSSDSAAVPAVTTPPPSPTMVTLPDTEAPVTGAASTSVAPPGEPLATTDTGTTDTATTDAGTTDTATTDAATAVATDTPTICDLGEHVDGDGVVQLTVWKFNDDRAGSMVQEGIDTFNASQSGVHVELIDYDSPEQMIDLWTKTDPSERPALMLLSEDSLGQMHALDGLLDVGDCLSADGPLVPAIEATFTLDGVLQAAPWGISTPLLYFDAAAFRNIGLDPTKPPTDERQLRDALQIFVDTGSRPEGFTIEGGDNSGGSWYVEQWLAQQGAPSLLPDNGRNGPATTVAWDTPAAIDGLVFLRGLLADRLATRVDDSSITDLTDIGAKQAAMAIHTSGSLGDVIDALDGNIYPGVELGVAPLPGPGTGSLVGGTAWWASSAASPAAQRATWTLLRFLESPPQQAALAIETGYVPVRVDSVDDPAFVAAAAEHAGLLVGFQQLMAVDPTAARLTPVTPMWSTLRPILGAAVRAVLFDGADPTTTMRAAAAQANAILAAG